jgi:molecular chaperone HtpG
MLYTNNPEEQHAQIEAAKERGYQVIVVEGPLGAHYITQVEQKNSGLRFKRIDSDVMDKLIEKDDEMPSTLSDEQKNNLKTAIENFVDKKKFQVEFASLSPTEAPFVVTQNEFMRRMKEQSQMGGGGFYGSLPDSYNLVANANHPMFSNTLTDAEGKTVLNDDKVKQAIDLALLAKGLLKGEDLTKFVKTNLEKLAQ